MKTLGKERNKTEGKKYSYNELALAFYKKEISLEEYIERYNRLIVEEAEKPKEEVVLPPTPDQEAKGIDQKDLDDAFKELTKRKD